jgi:glutathione S-transferase
VSGQRLVPVIADDGHVVCDSTAILGYLEQHWYGFAVHKGYITRRHEEAVIELGVSPAHRRSVRCKAYAALGLFPAA